MPVRWVSARLSNNGVSITTQRLLCEVTEVCACLNDFLKNTAESRLRVLCAVRCSNDLIQQRIFEGNEPRQKVSDLEEEAIKVSRVRQPGLVARW